MTNHKNLTKELATREMYNAFLHYMGILPNPDKVLRNTGKTIEAYRDLKNDAHVWSCIQSRKSGLLSLPWTLLPNGASQAVTSAVQSMLTDTGMQQLLRDILEAPLFGWQPLEIIWEPRGGQRKYLVPARITAKPQEWFFFDGNGRLRFRRQGEIKGVEPPPMKMIAVQYEPSYMNPYGHSLLSKCYWPVTFKNGGLRFWVSFTEKYGMPILMGQYTRGATYEESRNLAEDLANMTEDSVIVAPSDIKIELHEAVRSSSSNLYRELIKYCNAEISKAILSQTLTTELDMGSYAASQTHYMIRREVIMSDVRLVESAVNRLIEYIVALNYSGSACPQFNMIMNDSDNMQKVDRDLKLMQTGSLQFTRKYWMDTYGFKDDEIK